MEEQIKETQIIPIPDITLRPQEETRQEIKQEENEINAMDLIRDADEMRSKWDYDKALNLYSKASQMSPFLAKPYYKTGMVYYLQNNLDAAEIEWQKGWKLEWQK